MLHKVSQLNIMEEDQCWIKSRRKYSMSSNLDSSTNYPSSYDDHSSWEEQAFAKDAARSGCTWPPRSYSCSFCRREFRSAQALGGHMNVHRRDRQDSSSHIALRMKS
ncbi:hypothetical protein JHK82_043448 [Glycine max]|nr:hypothetical protein JHK82_043448 [Glycine max]